VLNDLFVRISNRELLEFLSELREHNFASKVINRINSRSMRINFRILKFQRTISKYLIYSHYEFIQLNLLSAFNALFIYRKMLYLYIFILCYESIFVV